MLAAEYRYLVTRVENGVSRAALQPIPFVKQRELALMRHRLAVLRETKGELWGILDLKTGKEWFPKHGWCCSWGLHTELKDSLVFHIWCSVVFKQGRVL